jgi:hypothetical protein
VGELRDQRLRIPACGAAWPAFARQAPGQTAELFLELRLRRQEHTEPITHMIFVFALTFAGLIAGIAWLWRLKAVPVWARLSAMVPVGFAAWCVLGMATSLVSAFMIPEDLPSPERARQLATHISCVASRGMLFVVAGLISTFWLLFIGSRWKAPSAARDDDPETPADE